MRTSKLSVLTLILIAVFTLFLPFFAVAERYQINTAEGNWSLECDIEIPQAFGRDVSEYQYNQKSVNTSQLNSVFYGSFQSPPLFKLASDNSCSAYSAEDVSLSVPEFVSITALPSSTQQQVIDDILNALNKLDFKPYLSLYQCTTLHNLFSEDNESVIGNLVGSFEQYQQSICNGNTSIQLHPDDLLAVFASEIDGYPVIPHLFGSFSDSDVPVMAAAVIHDNYCRYIKINGSYDITSENTISAELVTPTAALNTAVNYAYAQWKQGFEIMSMTYEAGFDYPEFYNMYNPSYKLKVISEIPCYYCNNNTLSPAYKINMTVDVLLDNDEGLSSAERHKYLPESIRCSYLVNAITGEVVR